MKLILRLVSLYRPYAGWLILSLGLSVMTLLANMALLAISGWFVTAMAIAGAGSGTLNYFTPAALIRGAAILRTGGRYLERLAAHETTFRLLKRLRVWLFERIELVPLIRLDTYSHADIANRLRADVDRLETVYLRILSPVMAAVAVCGLLLAYLASHAVEFALAEGLALAVAGLAAPLLVLRLTNRWSCQQVGLSNRLNEMVVDGVQGMGELLTFGPAKKRFLVRFQESSRDLERLQVRQGAAHGLTQAVLVLAANLALFAILVLGIPLVQDGTLERADLILVSLLSLAGFEAVAPLPQAFSVLGKATEAARRVFSLADAQTDSPLPGLIAKVPQRCDIRVSKLTFGYPSEASPVLKDLDILLPQGRRLAIVAPTGAGKSTLVGLLTGFLQSQTGDIALSGRPLQSYDPETLRHCFSVSFQQDGLFTGTIRDNLLLAAPAAEDQDLWRVLKAAQLGGFVSALPDGLDAYIGKAGLALSGGQARRLAVARALLKDAPVLILDEPGEGLDYKTERAMLRAVVDELNGRSLLLITHRRAGLDLMDDVIGLEGRLSHRGEGGIPAYSAFLQKYPSAHS